MGVPISAFNSAALLLNTDTLAGLRGTSPNQTDYKFPVIGIGDSSGNKIITWTPGAGPNVNWIDFASSITGAAPIISVLGGDTDINLNISAKGAGHVEFTGTGAIGVPSGTIGQRPTGFAGGFRYNSTLDEVEYYSIGSAAWEPLAAGSGVITAVNGTPPITTTTLAGVVTVALTTPLAEIYGGTHQSTYILGDTLYASAANTLSKLAGNITTGIQYLAQTGSGAVSAAPVWTTISGADITGAALTKTDDTNVTLTLGGTPTTALLRAASLTLGWTGTLAVPRGGTGDASFTAYSVICGGTTSTAALQNVSGIGTSGQVLTSNGAAALPTWQTPAAGGVSSVTGTVNRITSSPTTGAVIVDIAATYAGQASITTVGALASGSLVAGFTPVTVPIGGTGATSFTAYSVICGGTTSTGTLQNVSGVGSSGQVLTSNGAAALPTWQSVTAGVSSVSGTTNRITVSPTTGATIVDIAATYVGQASITTVGALSSGSLVAGFTPVTVPIGGTGATSFTAYSVICGGTTSTGTLQNVSGVGTSGQVLTSAGAGALPAWQTPSGGTATALTDSITQASHGFSVGQLVYLNGATYTLAKANNIATAEVVGIVTAVTNVNVFVLTTSGYCTGLSGLTAGNVMWLSDATAGLMTSTEPLTVGNIQKPVFVADSTTSGYFINYRGEVIPTTISFPLTVANGGTGATSFTAYQPVLGGTTSTGALQSVSTTNAISGQTLAYQGTSTNPAYSTIPGINMLVNGDFQVLQRFNSPIAVLASTTQYSWDRWQILTNANQASTLTTTTSTANNTQQARVQRNSGQTGTGTIRFCQSITVNNSRNAAGSFITLSFIGLCGANFSAASSNLTVTVYSGTGTNKSGINGAFTGSATPISTTATLTTSNQSFKFTSGSAVGSTVTQLAVEFSFAGVGTASTNDWFQVGDVQLEVNTIAAPFQRLSFEQALLNCQSYYYKTFNQGVVPAQNTASLTGSIGYFAQIGSTVAGFMLYFQFPVNLIGTANGSSTTFYSPSSASATWYNSSAAANSGTPAINNNSTHSMAVANPQVVGDLVGQKISVHFSTDVDLT